MNFFIEPLDLIKEKSNDGGLAWSCERPSK
jgi:hypothetical protein